MVLANRNSDSRSQSQLDLRRMANMVTNVGGNETLGGLSGGGNGGGVYGPDDGVGGHARATPLPPSAHLAGGGPPLPSLSPMDVGANGTLLKYQTLPANSLNSTPATSTYGMKTHYGCNDSPATTRHRKVVGLTRMIVVNFIIIAAVTSILLYLVIKTYKFQIESEENRIVLSEIETHIHNLTRHFQLLQYQTTQYRTSLDSKMDGNAFENGQLRNIIEKIKVHQTEMYNNLQIDNSKIIANLQVEIDALRQRLNKHKEEILLQGGGTAGGGVNTVEGGVHHGGGGANSELDQNNQKLIFLDKSSSDYVRVVNPVSVHNLSQFTIAFWAKSKTPRIGTVMSYSQGGKDVIFIGNRGLQAQLTDRQILVDLGDVKKVSMPHAINDQWHHFAITWRSISGTWVFYLDGNPVDAGQGLRPKQDVPSGGVFYFGSSIHAQAPDSPIFSGAQTFKGELTGINIWKYAMAKEAVRLIADPCISTMTKGNVISWPPDMDNMGAVSLVKGSPCWD